MNAKNIIIFSLGSLIALGGCAKEAVEESPAPEEAIVAPAPEPEPEEITEMPVIEQPVQAPPQEMIIPQSEFQGIEQEPAGTLHPDSVSYLYMIRRDDYLTKIAFNEYGNPNEWRRIYQWNRDRIGDDPNLIYPYNDLELFKPESEIEPVEYDYIIHKVTAGETLWSIASQEYGDELVWIIIFWDNEDVLSTRQGLLKPGMELRIRTRLF